MADLVFKNASDHVSDLVGYRIGVLVACHLELATQATEAVVTLQIGLLHLRGKATSGETFGLEVVSVGPIS